MQNKILKFISAAALFSALVSPLIFFKELTMNPFSAQILILNFSLFVFCLCNLGRARANKIDAAFFIFTGVLFLTWLISLFSGYRLSIFYNFFGYGGILVTWFLAYCAGRSLDAGRRTFALNTLFAVGTIAAVYGILQACGIEPVWARGYNAGVISTFGNPNFLSGFLLLLVFPLIYFSLQNTKQKYFYAAALLICGMFIVISGARSSMAALALGVIGIFFYKPLRAVIFKNKKRVLVFLLLFVFVFLILPSKSKSVLNSKTAEQVKIMRGDKTPQSYAQRKMLWAAAAKIFVSEPLAGRGFGNYYLYYGFEQGKMLFDNPALQVYRVQSYNAHNFILQLAAESGILGLAAFTALAYAFFYYLRRYFKSKEKDKQIFFLTIALLAFLADNMLNITLFVAAPAFLFWFFAGVLSSEIYKGREAEINLWYKIFLIIFFGAFLTVSVKILISEIYHLNGFEAYLSKNSYSAERELNQSVQVYKGNYEAEFFKGNNETALGDNIAALASFSRAAVLNQSYDEPPFNAAATAYALENFADAKNYVLAALRLNPGRNFSYLILANSVLKTASLTPEDAKYLTRGLTLFEGDMMLCQSVGDAFVHTEKDKAVKIFEGCVLADTLDKGVLSRLEQMSQSSGVITQASLAQSLYGLLSKGGRPSENIISGVELYAQTYPADPNAALMLARAKYNSGDLDGALAVLSAAVSKYPQNRSLQTAFENTKRKMLDKK